MKKSYMVFIAIVFCILAFIIFHLKTMEEIGLNDNVQHFETEKVKQYKEELKEIFSQCEKEYQEVLTKTDFYDRTVFYSSVRMQNYSSEGEVKFSNLETDGDEIYDFNGNKVDKLPTPMYKGKEVEISDVDELLENHYYFIKYQASNDNNTYGYIGRLTKKGFENLEFYCIINENLNSDFILEETLP